MIDLSAECSRQRERRAQAPKERKELVLSEGQCDWNRISRHGEGGCRNIVCNDNVWRGRQGLDE